jgi:hypothetical protein
VVGVVSEADLLLKEDVPEGPAGGRLFQSRRQRKDRANAAGEPAAELMTSPAVTVGPDATVAEAARLLHCYGVNRSLIPMAVSLVRGLFGVVDVVNGLTFEWTTAPPWSPRTC